MSLPKKEGLRGCFSAAGLTGIESVAVRTCFSNEEAMKILNDRTLTALEDEIRPIVELFLSGDPTLGKKPLAAEVNDWVQDILSRLGQLSCENFDNMLDAMQARNFDLTERGIITSIIREKLHKSKGTLQEFVRGILIDVFREGSSAPIQPNAELVLLWEKRLWELIRLHGADPEVDSPPADDAPLHYRVGYYQATIEEMFSKYKGGERPRDEIDRNLLLQKRFGSAE